MRSTALAVPADVVPTEFVYTRFVRVSVVCVVAATAFARVDPPVPPLLPQASTFDVDADGWDLVDKVVYRAEGGNPGGYLRGESMGDADGPRLDPPMRYTGDWTTLDGVGVIRFDYRVFDTGGEPCTPGIGPDPRYSIWLGGPFGEAFWIGPPIPHATTGWVELEARLVESEWDVWRGTWGELLSWVTFMDMRLGQLCNAGPDAERTGVDNVVVTSSCPGDIAPPYGRFDLADIDRFITSFLSAESPADLATPFGQLDLADIDAFLDAFSAGCGVGGV